MLSCQRPERGQRGISHVGRRNAPGRATNDNHSEVACSCWHVLLLSIVCCSDDQPPAAILVDRGRPTTRIMKILFLPQVMTAVKSLPCCCPGERGSLGEV
ncbi:hypothetical protein LIA77_11632 [Sarocladium implicatum]|nr:hypothetical protein LIA77_11632 [Sarocladium implicatum]